MKGTGYSGRRSQLAIRPRPREPRDETHLLTGALRDGEEVRNVGRREDLVLRGRERLEELGEECLGLVELRVRLEDRDLDVRVVDVREALLDAAQPVAGEVAERRVDPALLVRDVHEADEARVDLGVRHVGEVAGSAVGLGREPRLLEVGVETVDHVLLVVGEPCDLLLLREREDLPANGESGKVSTACEARMDSDEARRTCQTRPRA